MKIQEFIEKNAGKSIGDEYIYDKMILYTRFPYATEPHLVEVGMFLRFCYWGYSDIFDIREISDNVKFYGWLETVFFIKAEKQLKNYFQKKGN